MTNSVGSAFDRELAESYLLEIVGRARSAHERCQSLLAEDFFSEVPRIVARSLAGIALYFERAAIALFSQIEWSDPESVEKDLYSLRTIDSRVQRLASHLRYVQGARPDRLPWQLLPAFERFVAKLLPDRSFLLRTKWNYNFTVTPDDFWASYRSELLELEDCFPSDGEATQLLVEISAPLRIIAFPSLERLNILQISLLGHELGHLFVPEVLSDDRKQAFKEAIAPKIDDLTQREMQLLGPEPKGSSADLFWTTELRRRKSDNLWTATRCWSRAVEELLSDAIGILLFGPAALFALLEIAVQHDLDSLPEPRSDFYPPWRMRLRKALDLLESRGARLIQSRQSGLVPDRARRIDERIVQIRTLCASQSDQEVLSMAPLQRSVYEHVTRSLEEGLTYLLSLPVLREAWEALNREDFSSKLPPLIERLDFDIPPNAVKEGLGDRSPAEIVSILNAAWFHRVSSGSEVLTSENQLRVEALEARQRANRLTLKAIELSQLAEDFWKETRTAPFEKRAVNSAGDERPWPHPHGVLSRGDLAEAMNRTKLDRRLIVTPMLDPENAISAGAIDVRLGCEFLVFRRESFLALDVGDEKEIEAEYERYQHRRIRAFGQSFVLHPRQLVIGSTLEYIQVPPDLMCYVSGKSTWGRMGLIIATATKVDPGFRGCITLEIVNEGEVPLVLYPGLPIAQLVVHQTSDSGRYSGGYSCAIGPEFPRFVRKRAEWEFWTRPRKPRPGLDPKD